MSPASCRCYERFAQQRGIAGAGGLQHQRLGKRMVEGHPVGGFGGTARLFQRLPRQTLGGGKRTRRAPQCGVDQIGVDLVAPVGDRPGLVPVADDVGGLAVVAGGVGVAEQQFLGLGAVNIDLGVLQNALAQRGDLLVAGGPKRGHALLGLLTEAVCGIERALQFGLVGELRQALDFGIGVLQRVARLAGLGEAGDLLAQPRLDAVGIVAGADVERAHHGEDDAHRHAAGSGQRLGLGAAHVGQVGNAHQQLAALAENGGLVGIGGRRRLAEIEEPPQAFVDPGVLAALGVEIDLLRHHAHDCAELRAGDRTQMLEQRRRIGAVAVLVAVERRLARFGGKADDGAEAFLLGSRRGECLGPAGVGDRQSGRRDRRRFGVGRKPERGAGRERVVAAGVEQHDGDGDVAAQFGDDLRDRHELVACVVEGGQVGVHGNEEIFAAGLDAVAGVVEDGDVGALGVVDEILEVSRQPARVAVGRQVGVETEVGKQFLDVAGVGFRIAELRQVLVVAVADHQRDAAQRIRSGGRGKRDENRRQRRGKCHQHQRRNPSCCRAP